MSRPPNLLPEQRPTPEWRGKRKERYVFVDSQRVMVILTLIIFILIALVGGLATVAYMKPQIIMALLPGNPLQTVTAEHIGLDGTALALQQTTDAYKLLLQQTEAALRQMGTAERLALDNTAVALNLTDQTAAQRSLNLQSTQAALNNRQDLINQAETQVALNIISTRTAVALSNAEEATQVALDYASTQSALNQRATQVELDYQATRAALDQAQQAAAVSVPTATSVPPTETLTPTPLPTVTLTPTPTSTPSPTAAALLDDNFGSGLRSSEWSFLPDQWSPADDKVLTARAMSAWLLTRQNNLSDYALEVDFTPLFDLPSNYFILLNISSNSEQNLALRLAHDGRQITQAALYTFARYQFMSGTGLPDSLQSASPLAAETVNSPARDAYVRVEMRGSQISVSINDQSVLSKQLNNISPRGAVGLQMPVGTRLKRIQIMPLN